MKLSDKEKEIVINNRIGNLSNLIENHTMTINHVSSNYYEDSLKDLNRSLENLKTIEKEINNIISTITEEFVIEDKRELPSIEKDLLSDAIVWFKSLTLRERASSTSSDEFCPAATEGYSYIHEGCYYLNDAIIREYEEELKLAKAWVMKDKSNQKFLLKFDDVQKFTRNRGVKLSLGEIVIGYDSYTLTTVRKVDAVIVYTKENRKY